MDPLGLIASLALTAAAAVMVAGTAWRMVGWARTPQPLRIPTTPAPLGAVGVAARLAREVLLFASLFRASPWTWLFGWVFHAALAAVLVAHLRFFVEPAWGWLAAASALAPAAGTAMVAGIAGLWARRVLVDRVRFISSPSDHLLLALLAAIALTGLALHGPARTDVVEVKAFALGLAHARWQSLPPDPVLLAHLAGAAALMLVFPFGKLLHAPGVFFSPALAQADDARERRAPRG